MQPVRLRGLQWQLQVVLLSTVTASTLFANSIKSFNLQANPLTSRNDISSLSLRSAASRAGNDASTHRVYRRARQPSAPEAQQWGWRVCEWRLRAQGREGRASNSVNVNRRRQTRATLGINCSDQTDGCWLLLTQEQRNRQNATIMNAGSKDCTCKWQKRIEQKPHLRP